MGKGENSSFPFWFFLAGWNNQNNRRQTDRKSKLICAQDPHPHERVRDPAYMRGAEKERGIEVYNTS